MDTSNPETHTLLQHPLMMLESHLTEEERALLPLMAWAQPIIDAAQNRVLTSLGRLATRYPDRLNRETLEASVRAAFVRPVIEWSQRTLLLELGIARHYQQLQGATPEQRFASFVAWIGSSTQQRRIAADYPLLRQDIRLRCRQVAKFLVSMLTRVARDLPRLAALHAAQNGSDAAGTETGPLLHFKTQMGQRRSGGESVTQLNFAHACIHYKPHGLALEVAYCRLLAWMAQNGVQPGQRGPVALDRGTYGYVAHAGFAPCENASEVNEYYRRFGGLVALTHALGTTALRHKNLIAAGPWPVLIDLETLLQPALATTPGKIAPAAPGIAAGLLPQADLPPPQIDSSALSLPQTALFSRKPIHAGTDQMKIMLQRVAEPFASNMPRLQNQLVQPHEYSDAICAGFEQTYRGLLAHKAALLAPDGPLAAFRSLRVRTVLRTNQVYEAALMALTHPNYLESEDQRERLIARLRPANVSGEAARRTHLKKTPLLRCWPSERLALQRGDIPYFTAQIDSRDGCDEQGEIMEGLFATSAWNRAERLIKGLSLRDLQRQLHWVRAAINSSRPDAFTQKNDSLKEKA